MTIRLYSLKAAIILTTKINVKRTCKCVKLLYNFISIELTYAFYLYEFHRKSTIYRRLNNNLTNPKKQLLFPLSI